MRLCILAGYHGRKEFDLIYDSTYCTDCGTALAIIRDYVVVVHIMVFILHIDFNTLLMSLRTPPRFQHAVNFSWFVVVSLRAAYDYIILLRM